MKKPRYKYCARCGKIHPIFALCVERVMTVLERAFSKLACFSSKHILAGKEPILNEEESAAFDEWNRLRP